MLSRVVLIPLVAILVGCGGGPAGAKPTYQVTGKVTSAGAPLAKATVIFVPAVAGKGVVARGLTDAEGNYQLTTYDANDGAAEGDYKVAVQKFAASSAPAAAGGADGHGAGVAGSSAPGAHSAKAAQDGGSLIDPKYKSAESSGLTATVKSSGENNFDFPLD